MLGAAFYKKMLKETWFSASFLLPACCPLCFISLSVVLVGNIKQKWFSLCSDKLQSYCLKFPFFNFILPHLENKLLTAG